jgi:hypothetical protein
MIKNKTLLAALSLIIIACASKSDKPEIHAKYLACYALDPQAKQQCLESLQYELEKQGFKIFINNLGLPCDKVEEGPEFMEEKQAYLIKCQPAYEYLMLFNYDTKEWKLIKGEE